jgi:hypothetical protein
MKSHPVAEAHRRPFSSWLGTVRAVHRLLGTLSRKEEQDVDILERHCRRRRDLKRNKAEGVARLKRRRPSLDEEPNQVQRRSSIRHSNEQGDPPPLILDLERPGPRFNKDPGHIQRWFRLVQPEVQGKPSRIVLDLERRRLRLN